MILIIEKRWNVVSFKREKYERILWKFRRWRNLVRFRIVKMKG